MPLFRLAGAVFVLLAAWTFVAALLVLGTAALALLVLPSAGALALVVGVAALAVPGLLTLAAGALVTVRPEGPALSVVAATTTLAAATTGLLGSGLPGHVEVVAVVAVLVAAILAVHMSLVVPPVLARAATGAPALLLAAYGLTALIGLPGLGSAVATPGALALVTAGVAGRAWWTWRSGTPETAGLVGTSAAMSLLLLVLAWRSGIDPLPAAVALGVLAPLAVDLVLRARQTTTRWSALVGR